MLGYFDRFTIAARFTAESPNGAIVTRAKIEQAGGSPDGNPHSAPVYVGKLVETVPPPAPAATKGR